MSLAMKSSRRASVRPAARARLSEQKLASSRPSTLTRQRRFSRHSRVTKCVRTANVVRAGLLNVPIITLRRGRGRSFGRAAVDRTSSLYVTRVVSPGLCSGPRFGRDSQARRAGHAANVLRRVALLGRAASDAVVLGVIPVDETNLGFHEDLRGAGQGAHLAAPPPSELTCSSPRPIHSGASGRPASDHTGAHGGDTGVQAAPTFRGSVRGSGARRPTWPSSAPGSTGGVLAIGQAHASPFRDIAHRASPGHSWWCADARGLLLSGSAMPTSHGEGESYYIANSRPVAAMSAKLPWLARGAAAGADITAR